MRPPTEAARILIFGKKNFTKPVFQKIQGLFDRFPGKVPPAPLLFTERPPLQPGPKLPDPAASREGIRPHPLEAFRNQGIAAVPQQEARLDDLGAKTGLFQPVKAGLFPPKKTGDGLDIGKRGLKAHAQAFDRRAKLRILALQMDPSRSHGGFLHLANQG